MAFPTDGVDSCILSDLAADDADYEAESWSLAVEHKFCKKQDKRAVKRQDVIYGERTATRHHRTHLLSRRPEASLTALRPVFVAAQS